MQKKVIMFEIKGKILQISNPELEQLKTSCTMGTIINLHKIVIKLIQKLGIKVITIKTFFLTKDCIVW